MREKVEQALNKIKPHLQADGGDVELVEISAEGVVKIHLKGSCLCCPMASMTIEQGIGRILREEVPEIKEIVVV